MIRRSNSRSGRRRHRGAAMLETAIVLPLLMLMMVGIIEAGRVVMIYQVTTNTSREACRRAVIPGATNAQIITICNDYLDSAGIASTGRNIEVVDSSGIAVDLSTIPSHEPVTIRLSLPFAANTWGLSTIMADKTLSSEVTMRRE